MTILWGRLWIKGFVFGIIFFWLLLPLLQGLVITLYLKTKKLMPVLLLSNWFFILILIFSFLQEVLSWQRHSSFDVIWDFVVIPAILLFSIALMSCSTFLGYKMSLFVINQIPWKRKKDDELVVADATKYAGFWYRAGACYIDYYVFMLCSVLSVVAMGFILNILGLLRNDSSHGATTWILFLTLGITPFVLRIYFHAKRGQTVGKIAGKLKVVNLDGRDISWKTAVLRSTPEFLFAFFAVIGICLATISIPETVLRDMDRRQRNQMTYENMPEFIQWACWAFFAWLVLDIMVLFLNKKKRALHDFIAGTMVIHTGDKK